MIDEELVDPPIPVQEPNTEDIALTVINEQKAEVDLVEPPEEQEVESIQIVQNITEELISEVVLYEFVKARICNEILV